MELGPAVIKNEGFNIKRQTLVTVLMDKLSMLSKDKFPPKFFFFL